MSRLHTLLLALGIISAFMVGPSPAEAQNDFHALYNRYRFHHVGYSPRSAAMGGAYSALQDNENGLVGNPASLGFKTAPFIVGGYDWENVSSDLTLLNPNAPVEGEADLMTVNVGGAYPFEWGAVGLQYAYRWDELDSDDAPSAVGFMNQDGELDRSYIGLGVGYKMMEDIALGYRFGYFDWDLERDINVVRPAPFQLAQIDEDFSGHRHQFGVQYLAHEQLVLGLDGYFALGDRDSGTLGDADADSYAVRGGLAWQVTPDLPLTVAMDLNYEIRDLDGAGNDAEEDLFGIHLGVEYEVYENLFLRGGYQFEDIDYEDVPANIDESLSISGFSLGLGYEYENITFDYAFQFIDTGSGDLAHYFGIGYQF